MNPMLETGKTTGQMAPNIQHYYFGVQVFENADKI